MEIIAENYWERCPPDWDWIEVERDLTWLHNY